MANTDLSYYASDVYIGGNFMLEWMEAGDASIKPGYLLQDDETTGGEMLVNPTDSYYLSGQAALKSDQEIDTLYTNGEAIPMYAPIGTKVWAKHDGGDEQIYFGAAMGCSDGTAGAVELFANIYSASGTIRQTTMAICVFSAQDLDTEAVAKWLKVILGR